MSKRSVYALIDTYIINEVVTVSNPTTNAQWAIIDAEMATVLAIATATEVAHAAMSEYDLSGVLNPEETDDN